MGLIDLYFNADDYIQFNDRKSVHEYAMLYYFNGFWLSVCVVIVD
jgi:hypothetical protein